MSPEEMAEGLRILEKAQQSGLLPELLEQLQKDYERAGIVFPIQEQALQKPQISALYSSLRENIYLLLMERFNQYLNLMYAVDVPERDFRTIAPADAVEAAGQLTGLVLAREWQKLEIRRRFRTSGSA